MRRIALGVLAVVVLVVAFWWWKGRGERTGTATGTATATPTATATATATATGSATAVVKPGRLEGRVHDGAGAAIAGAVIRVEGGDGPQTVAARGDGTFEVGELAAGDYRVAVAAPGFVPHQDDAVVVRAGETARLDVTLAAGGTAVVGTISDAMGGPIEGAVVSAARRRGPLDQGQTSAATLTDRDGHYRLSLAPGSYGVAAEHDDYLRAATTIELAAAELTVDLRLVPGGVIEGVVKDVATGAVVAGAEVVAEGERLGFLGGGGRHRATPSDPAGRFRLTGLPPGALRLTAQVQADGRRSREPLVATLGIGEAVTGVELWIEAAPYVAGRVVDERGRGIADAAVVIMAPTSAEAATTDADGAFRVLGVEPGTYRVMASHRDHQPAAPQQLVVAERPVTDVVIELAASPRVVGRVEPPTEAAISVDPDAGPGGFDTLMFADGDTSLSGPDGRFQVSPIKPGRHVVDAKASDGRRGQVAVEVPAVGEVEAVIRLEERGSIAGTVRDQHGAPLGGVTVSVRGAGAVLHRVIVNGVEVSADRVVTAADGGFVVRGLDAGSYALGVLDERGGALRAVGGKPGPLATVKLAANEQKRGVALAVELDDGIIRGVVKDASGAPKADAWVRAALRPEALMPTRGDGDDGPGSSSSTQVVVMRTDGDDGGAAAPVLTDAQGRFEIARLRRGTYDLVAEADRGALHGRTDGVATGGTATITLGGLGAIAGVVTVAGAPATDFTVELAAPGPGDGGHRQRVRTADGRFRLERLEPGRYTVDARAPAGRGSAEAVVTAGGTVEVAIALVGDATIRGRVRDAAGRPLANASILNLPGGPSDGHGSFSFDGPPAMTDADGRFEITVAPGAWRLIALAGGTPSDLGYTVTVAAGQVVDAGDLTAGPMTPPPPRPDAGP